VDWLTTELALARAGTQRPWGVGLITWHVDPAVFELALSCRPAAFVLSFGDPRPYAPAIKAAGCKLICQVQDVDQARLAWAAGADLIVAQGTEAGGHGGERATLPLVPAVVDAVGPVPVIAAGGIGDGRGLAAALMLGAHGVLLGSRFCATPEALVSDDAKRRIVAAHATDTARTRVFDVVRGYAWPAGYRGRALRNRFTARWDGRENELSAAIESERPAYAAASERGDCDTALVWAGEVVDLIDRVDSVADICERIAAEAETCLAGAKRFLGV